MSCDGPDHCLCFPGIEDNVKNSIWTFALYVTSGVALTGCRHADDTFCPVNCNQHLRYPVRVANDERVVQTETKPIDSSEEHIIILADDTLSPVEAHSTFPDRRMPMAGPGFVLMETPPQPLFACKKSEGTKGSQGKEDEAAVPLPPPPSAPKESKTPRPATIYPMAYALGSTPEAPEAAPTDPTETMPVRNVVQFSHSEDYGVLTGTVQSWRQDWKLRYADYGTLDPHGGSVVLEGDLLDELEDGCQVRATGRLIPSSRRSSPARFQVQSLEITSEPRP